MNAQVKADAARLCITLETVDPKTHSFEVERPSMSPLWSPICVTPPQQNRDGNVRFLILWECTA